MKSESIAELAKALCKVQAVIENAKKDSSNPFFKSHYADLASVWEVARKPLTDNGLSVSQLPGGCDGTKVKVQTILMHTSGEWLCSEFEMPYIKQDPQAVGSAITYARRYALAAIVGIVADPDDDAESAVKRDVTPPPKQQEVKQTSEPSKDLAKEINKMLIEMEGNEYDASLKLIELSGFMGKNRDTGEEKWVDGKGDPKLFSAKMLPVAYGKVQKAYQAWEDEEDEGGMIE